MRILARYLAFTCVLFSLAGLPALAQEAATPAVDASIVPAVASAAVTMTKPTLVSVATLSAGDSAWMLMSTALVLLRLSVP